MKRLLFLLVLNLFQQLAIAQTTKTIGGPNRTIDSLLTVLKTAKEDTNKVGVLNKLCREYTNISEYSKSIQYSKEVLKTASAIMSATSQAAVKKAAQKGMANAYNNIGIIYNEQGYFDRALESHFASLKINEEIGDKKGISASLNNMGLIYDKQGNNDKALESHLASLKIKVETGDKKGAAASFNNLGLIYHKQGNYEKALEFQFKALKLGEEIGNKGIIGNAYNNMGNIYSSQGKDEKALESYFASLKIKEAIGDKKGIAVAYNNIGSIYLRQNKIEEARKMLLASLSIAKEVGLKERMKRSYELLSLCDSATGNWKGAFEYHRLYSQINDSMFNEQSSKQIAEMSTKYETEKKEQQIQLLEKDSEIQKNVRNSFMAGFALVLLLAGVSFRGYKQKQKANILLGQQKNIIEEKNNDIMDSIHYANRIQTALLKEEEHFTEHLPPHFILFKPKDILSGDFYWSIEKQDHLYIAAADCTGHGVPGAMMSMLGIAFLNEITGSEKLQTPAEILDLLRDKIIKDLKSKDGITTDGMDISFVRLNLKTQELLWAGANNPLWIIKPSETPAEIHEVRPDKQPIGFYHDFKPFTDHNISLGEGDTLYLFTDGFADQFGGDKGKKFKYAKLKELLLSIQDRSMPEQKEILNETFVTWKDNLEQVDDVCIIGIKI